MGRIDGCEHRDLWVDDFKWNGKLMVRIFCPECTLIVKQDASEREKWIKKVKGREITQAMVRKVQREHRESHQPRKRRSTPRRRRPVRRPAHFPVGGDGFSYLEAMKAYWKNV